MGLFDLPIIGDSLDPLLKFLNQGPTTGTPQPIPNANTIGQLPINPLPNVGSIPQPSAMPLASTSTPGNAVANLMSQAVNPIQSAFSPVSLLSLLAQLRSGQTASTGTSSGGGGALPPTGPLDMRDFQNWAQKYGQSGVPENLLVALKSGSYPMTDNALYARPDLAAAFRTASRAFHGDTGDWLRQYLVSGWRPFQSSSPKAIDMKSSDHWLAGAIDLTGGSIADMWMRQHGANFGFDPSASGFNWNDPGHFSFSAGGFTGGNSGSGWGIPTAADAQWIALAKQLWGI